MTAIELDPQSRERVWWYFFDVRLRYAFVLLFVGMALVQLPLGKVMLLVGLTWVTAFVLLGRSRLSEGEVDRLLAEDLDALVQEAERRFRVEDQELRVKPLTLLGPVEINVPAYYQFLCGPRSGSDGRRRSPINRVVILLPMESRLGIYTCQRDFLKGITSKITIEEHNYKDVVSVRLETLSEREKVKFLDPATPTSDQVLTLELRNQTKLTFPVSGGRPNDGVEDDGGPITGAERTLRAIQTLLGDRR